MIGKISIGMILTGLLVLSMMASAAYVHAATAYASLGVTATFSPSGIGPGESGNMILTIANSGTAYARNVKLTVRTNSILTFGQQQFDLQTISPASSVQVSVPVSVQSSATQNTASIFLSISYQEGDNAGTSTIESSVSMPISSRMFVEVQGVTFSETVIQPGDVVDISVSLKNVGQGALKSATAMLDGTALPFVSASGDNDKFLGDLASGSSQTVRFSIILNKNAQTTAYSVPLVLNYYDDSGVLHTDTKYIGIKVTGIPDFVVAFESGDNMFAGSEGELTISIANRGTATANYLTLTFDSDGSQDNMFIQPSGYYVGNLDPDDFQTVKLTVDLTGLQPGKKTLGITMQYKDPYNKEMTKTDEVGFTVYPRQESGSLSLVVVVLAAIAAVLVWKRRAVMKMLGRKGQA
jgi:hypothetical protein